MKRTILFTIILLLVLSIPFRSNAQELKYAVATPPQTSSYYSSTENIGIGPDGNIITAGRHSDGIWLSKHTPNGESLWSVVVPLSPYYFDMDMALDPKGNIYVCGGIDHSFDADPSTDTAIIETHSDRSGYLLKYDKDGKYLWGFSIANGANILNHITVDKDNNCYVSGLISNVLSKVDLDPSDSTAFIYAADSDIPFIAKYDEAGKYRWGFSYNSSATINDIITDSLNTLLVSGYSGFGKLDLDNGPDSAFVNESPLSKTFIARYQLDGSYVNSMAIGSASNYEHYYADVISTSIAADFDNNIVITGQASGDSIDFDPSSNEYLSSADAARWMFVSKYSSQFDFKWVFALQAQGQWRADSATHVSVDSKGNIYLSGRIGSDTIDVDPGTSPVLFSADPINAINFAEIFMGMYRPDGGYRWGYLCNSTGADWATCSVPDHLGNIYFAGMINGDSIDFDPGTSQVFLSSLIDVAYPKIRDNSPFIAKYSVPTSSVKDLRGSSVDKPLVTAGNGHLRIEVDVYALDDCSITIYDVLGNTIAKDVYQPHSVGTQNISLRFVDQAAGLYICELRSGTRRNTTKFIFTK